MWEEIRKENEERYRQLEENHEIYRRKQKKQGRSNGRDIRAQKKT